jgi:hypothetical protein
MSFFNWSGGPLAFKGDLWQVKKARLS